MYYTITSLFILAQLGAWLFYHEFILVPSSVKCTDPESSTVFFSISSYEKEDRYFSKNRIDIGRESVRRDYPSHNLIYSLSTLEFISFLEIKLETSLSSKLVSAENLKELLKIKKDVQLRILQSTKNREVI